MILWAALAMLCLVAGFGLGWYEYDLRWQIVRAVHRVRPGMEPLALFARARPLWRSEVIEVYRNHFPDSPLLTRRLVVSLAAPACFLLSTAFLVMAIRHS
jgi:hypothetical protein